MKVCVLFSGGKDSVYALFKAMREHEVMCLVTLVSENKESYMFHTPNIELTKLQAEAMQLPIITKNTAGVKEEELEDLKAAIAQAKEEYCIEGVVTGAIASNYQASRIEKICGELGLKCINPLWGMDQEELMREVAEKFEVIISGVFAEPLTEEWLGRRIDAAALEELKKLITVNIAGEGGEIETTVLDAPFFKKKIVIEDAKARMLGENSGVFEIKKARLVCG